MQTKFDAKTWTRFKAIAAPFFLSQKKWKAWGLLLLLICFSISVSGLNVVMSYIGRDFMTALSLRERDEFFYNLWRYLGAFAVATPIVVFYRYTEERLGLMWRKWLANEMLRRYLSHRSYYRIQTETLIDNPDQRLEADVRQFTAQSLSFLLIFINSCIALFFFVGILWSISANLVFAVVAYATFGSLTAYLLGRPLIALNFKQETKDADFRYKLVNVRDNSESVAFIGAERKEFTRAHQLLKSALNNLKYIINWNRNLNFFTTGYNYLVGILPTIIVAPLYLDGKIEFGVVTQAGFAFGQVLGALSIIVLNFNSISQFAAVITRLGGFWETVNGSPLVGRKATSRITLTDSDRLVFSDVTILTPNADKSLVRDLSFSLEPGGLLISGSSGTGKSSIFRAIAGLWSSGSGKIERPPISEARFLPQRPYMILGTLRNQVLYGAGKQGYSDPELREVLRRVELMELYDRVGGFDAVLDWPNILSIGEQQRLAFARLLLAKPRFVFLDEATTALDPHSEDLVYSLLREFTENYVSIGYKATLSRFHASRLDVLPEGNWRYVKLGTPEGGPANA